MLRTEWKGLWTNAQTQTPAIQGLKTPKKRAGGSKQNPGMASRHLPAGTPAKGNAVSFRAQQKAEAADVALAAKLRKRLGKEKGEQISAKDARYLLNQLKRADSIGAKTTQLLLHLLEHATLEEPQTWRAIFKAIQGRDDILENSLTPPKLASSLHALAGKFSSYKKLGAEEVQKLLALGTLRGIPKIEVRRALESIRRLHPSTQAADKLFATELAKIPIAPPKPWTFMIYMASENNLESYAVGDLNAMEQTFAKIAEFANVIVVADGGVVSEEDESTGPAPEVNWSSKTRLLLIEPDDGPKDGAVISKEIPVPHDSPLGELMAKGKGELNMGSGKTLEATVDFVQAAAQSDNFFLNFWSHGLAWKGIGEDTGHYGGDMLRPHELASALGGLERPIDVVGFDACLMANSGMGFLLSELGVQHMVGSQELLDATGWGYDKVFNAFAEAFEKSGELTPQALSDTIVDAASATTISSMRLDSAPKLWGGLDKLGEALMAEGGRNNAQIQGIIEALPRYGTFGVDASEEDKARGDEELVDVILLCQQLESEFGGTSDIGKAAKALRELTEGATHFKNEPSESYPDIENRSFGLTTYLPKTAEAFDSQYIGKGAIWKTAAPTWIKLLKQKPKS